MRWLNFSKPGDTSTNQLISITHERYQFFDNGFEVTGVFLDICKAFDQVWHDGLIYKLKQNEVAGDLLDTLTNFLKDRKQKVFLNGQHSTWKNVEAGFNSWIQVQFLDHYFSWYT